MTIIPIVPLHNLPIISVENGRVLVARYRDAGHHTFQVQIAANWEALEGDAKLAVEAMVGAIIGSEHYPCPEALAARAVWPAG